MCMYPHTFTFALTYTKHIEAETEAASRQECYRFKRKTMGRWLRGWSTCKSTDPRTHRKTWAAEAAGCHPSQWEAGREGPWSKRNWQAPHSARSWLNYINMHVLIPTCTSAHVNTHACNTHIHTTHEKKDFVDMVQIWPKQTDSFKEKLWDTGEFECGADT